MHAYNSGSLRVLCLFLWLAVPAVAQDSGLELQVSDVQGAPLGGVELETTGGGRPGATDSDGRLRLSLPEGTTAGQWVSLALVIDVDSPDLVFWSPWDGRVQIPLPDGAADRIVPIVVAERGSLDLLNDPSILAKHINASAAWAPEDPDPAAAIATARSNVAEAYGLSPDDVDTAIRNWGRQSGDRFEQGLAAYYSADFSTATTALTESLMEADAMPDATDGEVTERAFFLAQSLNAEARYVEAVIAYRRSERPGDEDSLLLALAGHAAWRSDQYAEAEALFMRSLAADEAALGPWHPRVGVTLNDLAGLFRAQGQYGQAESLLERAVEIGESSLGPDDPLFGLWLDSLGQLYRARGRFSEAEPLFRRSLAIAEASMGPEHPVVGDRLNQLADALQMQGLDAEAETHFVRALAIAETTLGPQHPTVGIRLNNLAMFYQSQARFAYAEELFQRALALLETALGPTHPNVTGVLQNYGMLLRAMGRPEEGAELERRAAQSRGR